MTSDYCNGTLTVNNILYGDITFTLNVNRTFFFLLKTVKCYQLTYCAPLKRQGKHQKSFYYHFKGAKTSSVSTPVLYIYIKPTR